MKWDSSRYGRLIRSACVAFTLAYVLSRKWDVAIAALLVVGFGTFLTWKPFQLARRMSIRPHSDRRVARRA